MTVINRPWNKFIQDPKYSKLPLNEQKRIYKLEQDTWKRHIRFIDSKFYQNPNIYK